MLRKFWHTYTYISSQVRYSTMFNFVFFFLTKSLYFRISSKVYRKILLLLFLPKLLGRFLQKIYICCQWTSIEENSICNFFRALPKPKFWYLGIPIHDYPKTRLYYVTSDNSCQSINDHIWPIAIYKMVKYGEIINIIREPFDSWLMSKILYHHSCQKSWTN